jgi:LuxR family maltose regulon positive regulatory protein
MLVLQAMVLQDQGKRGEALAVLRRALTLAEPQGYVRTFIDEGAPMGQILRQAAAREIRLNYVSKLLAALENETADRQRASRLASLPLHKPLSERELEVLRLLRTSLSTPEIARELYVSANTIRTHTRHIYAKLDVHSRSEAVARAEELGLL